MGSDRDRIVDTQMKIDHNEAYFPDRRPACGKV
jgi:hypothetical protein